MTLVARYRDSPPGCNSTLAPCRRPPPLAVKWPVIGSAAGLRHEGGWPEQGEDQRTTGHLQLGHLQQRSHGKLPLLLFGIPDCNRRLLQLGLSRMTDPKIAGRTNYFHLLRSRPASPPKLLDSRWRISIPYREMAAADTSYNRVPRIVSTLSHGTQMTLVDAASGKK